MLILFLSLYHCPPRYYCFCPCVTVHNVNIVYVSVPLFIMLILFLSLHHCPQRYYCLCPCITVHNVNIVFVPLSLSTTVLLFMSLYHCPQRYYCLCPCVTVHNCKTCNVDTAAHIMCKCSLTITSIPFSSGTAAF